MKDVPDFIVITEVELDFLDINNVHISQQICM